MVQQRQVYTKEFEEVQGLFQGDLRLVSKTRKQIDRGDMDKLGIRSFGMELEYKSLDRDSLFVYLALTYKDGARAPYPFDLLVAADFEGNRLHEIFDYTFREKKNKPFLFIISEPSNTKTQRYDEITELREGSRINDLIQILDKEYYTM